MVKGDLGIMESGCGESEASPALQMGPLSSVIKMATVLKWVRDTLK